MLVLVAFGGTEGLFQQPERSATYNQEPVPPMEDLEKK
jgi:hypothetical protein